MCVLGPNKGTDCNSMFVALSNGSDAELNCCGEGEQVKEFFKKAWELFIENKQDVLIALMTNKQSEISALIRIILVTNAWLNSVPRRASRSRLGVSM